MVAVSPKSFVRTELSHILPKPLSFAAVVSEGCKSPTSPRAYAKSFEECLTNGGKILLKNPGTYRGEPAVFFTKEEISTLSSPFRFTLVGKFTYGRPPMTVIRKFFTSLGLRSLKSVGLLQDNHVVIFINQEEDFSRLLMRSIWYVSGSPMKIMKWTPEFFPNIESPVVPVWVGFPGLPLHFFEKSAMYNLASAFGTPLKLDEPTALLSRPTVARVCIEMDISKPRNQRLWIGNEKEGFWQEVVFENPPTYCGFCKKLGHEEINCYIKNPELKKITTFVGKKHYVATSLQDKEKEQKQNCWKRKDPSEEKKREEEWTVVKGKNKKSSVELPSTLVMAEKAEEPKIMALSSPVFDQSIVYLTPFNQKKNNFIPNAQVNSSLGKLKDAVYQPLVSPPLTRSNVRSSSKSAERETSSAGVGVSKEQTTVPMSDWRSTLQKSTENETLSGSQLNGQKSISFPNQSLPEKSSCNATAATPVIDTDGFSTPEGVGIPVDRIIAPREEIELSLVQFYEGDLEFGPQQKQSNIDLGADRFLAAVATLNEVTEGPLFSGISSDRQGKQKIGLTDGPENILVVSMVGQPLQENFSSFGPNTFDFGLELEASGGLPELFGTPGLELEKSEIGHTLVAAVLGPDGQGFSEPCGLPDSSHNGLQLGIQNSKMDSPIKDLNSNEESIGPLLIEGVEGPIASMELNVAGQNCNPLDKEIEDNLSQKNSLIHDDHREVNFILNSSLLHEGISCANLVLFSGIEEDAKCFLNKEVKCCRTDSIFRPVPMDFLDLPSFVLISTIKKSSLKRFPNDLNWTFEEIIGPFLYTRDGKFSDQMEIGFKGMHYQFDIREGPCNELGVFDGPPSPPLEIWAPSDVDEDDIRDLVDKAIISIFFAPTEIILDKEDMDVCEWTIPRRSKRRGKKSRHFDL